MTIARTLMTAAVGLVGLSLTPVAEAAKGPGIEAIDEFRNGSGKRPAVQNRFFTKERRFEIAPMFGYVPNNPFSQRFVGGVAIAYHFSELIAAEGVVNYSPDLGVNDLKNLTRQLVVIANDGADNAEFQQPLDKVTLQAGFTARFTPLYGKINLFGEAVVNFDFYGSVGLGMLSLVNYYANYKDPGDDGEVVVLEEVGNEVKLSPIIGLGANFFINQTVALKLDARFNFYIDGQPDYDPSTENDDELTDQLNNNFVVSFGLALYFPKMKQRLYNF